MAKLFETTRERRLAIVVAILVALVLVGSSISIANHSAIVQAVNDDSVQDLDTAADKLNTSNTFSIITLLVSILALLTPPAILIYRKIKTNKVAV
jgi:hypothetical protein